MQTACQLEAQQELLLTRASSSPSLASSCDLDISLHGSEREHPKNEHSKRKKAEVSN